MDTSISRAQLPPLPPAVRMLTTNESQGLNLRNPRAKRTIENCVTCKGRKEFRWYDDGGQIVLYDCPCADQYVLSRYLWHCGVPILYQRMSWRDLTRLHSEAAEKVSEYLAMLEGAVDAGIGITFTGPPGTGKSLLSHLVMKDVIARGYDGYATTFSEMIDRFAEGWSSREQSQWFKARLRDAQVLLIDDLGREKNKGIGTVGENMLETVIRHRVACQLPTFITSNENADQIHSIYGVNTTSLLKECSTIIEVLGTDSRSAAYDDKLAEQRLNLTRPVML